MLGRWWLVTVLGVLCSFPVRGAAPAVFSAGAAMRVITPDPLLPISGGMGPTAPATAKRGELCARALVVAKGEARLAIVQVDALGFPGVLADRVRKRVPRIPAENLLVGATHTHSAPDLYAFPDGRGGHTGNLAHIDRVCREVAAAVNEALDRLQPAELRVASGEVQERIAYNYYAPALYDRRAGVVQLRRASGDKATIATLVNYAVHPEVLGAGQGIVSPDLVGPLCDELEARVGGMALFMNGALGGMVTADNRLLEQPSNAVRGVWKDARTWEECLRIGKALAKESLRLLRDVPYEAAPALAHRSREVRFPVESEAMWAVVQHSPLGYPHRQDRTITTRVNLVTLGPARILTIPGEALPNIGFYLKRKMGGQHQFLFGLTQDAFGYILTEVDFKSFPRYDYISRVSLGERTGTIFIRNALELVAEAESQR